MPLALIALGSNLGPRRACLEEALRRLAGLPGTRLLRRSAWARSEPEAPGDGPWYLNGAALISTGLRPRALLTQLQRIEVELGRRPRPADRARPLDLDLILYGLLRTTRRDLVVPHPRYRQRSFVLGPGREVAPLQWDPVLAGPLGSADEAP